MSQTPLEAIEKGHEAKEVDLTAAARGVWLVKVPKYLSEKWKKTGGDVGKLRIGRPKFEGGKPEVVFSQTDQQMAAGSQSTPRNHKFVLTGVMNQSLTIVSQHPSSDKVTIEGKVIQRAECRPMADDKTYMSLKRMRMEEVMKPDKEVKALDNVVIAFKPKSKHSFHIQDELKKKEEGKRTRMDKDQVMEVLLRAFEKHQYYNVKDLVTITKQPITYLRDILKEFCIYNTKMPHKNMWELKPEYRHYKDDQGK